MKEEDSFYRTLVRSSIKIMKTNWISSFIFSILIIFLLLQFFQNCSNLKSKDIDNINGSSENSSPPPVDSSPPPVEHLLLVDYLTDSCHTYISKIDPFELLSPYLGFCPTNKKISLKIFSVTHETENLSDGNMLGLQPPLPENPTPLDRPWNVHFNDSPTPENYAYEIQLNNRQSDFPNYISNNNRSISEGYIGSFTNLSLPFPANMSEDFRIDLLYKINRMETEASAEQRVTFGMVSSFKNNNNKELFHFMELNLKRSSSWDYCQETQIKGTPINDGLACDPTVDKLIDYRSYNIDNNEIVYFDASRLFPPKETPNQRLYKYSLPITDLFKKYFWKLGSNVSSVDIKIVGFYLGVEHHKGALTNIEVQEIKLLRGTSNEDEKKSIARLGNTSSDQNTNRDDWTSRPSSDSQSLSFSGTSGGQWTHTLSWWKEKKQVKIVSKWIHPNFSPSSGEVETWVDLPNVDSYKDKASPGSVIKNSDGQYVDIRVLFTLKRKLINNVIDQVTLDISHDVLACSDSICSPVGNRVDGPHSHGSISDYWIYKK